MASGHPYYDPYHHYREHAYSYGPPQHPYPPHHPSSNGFPVPQPHKFDADHKPYPSPASHQPPGSPEVEVISERKRRREEDDGPAKSDESQGTYIDDPLYLRQQILDNAQALAQTLCPAAYGPHNTGRYTLLLLQSKKEIFKLAGADGKERTKERWRAAVACDGMVVVEGPEAEGKSEALNVLLDALAKRLAKSVPRAWDDADSDDGAEGTNVEEDEKGARFATESKR